MLSPCAILLQMFKYNSILEVYEISIKNNKIWNESQLTNMHYLENTLS
jgi:hypothetical protein